MDYIGADALREKYRNDASADIAKIEEVDYICDAASMADAIGRSEYYDYIVASHVIEHIPDLVDGCPIDRLSLAKAVLEEQKSDRDWFP